jgi:hypothetical protein
MTTQTKRFFLTMKSANEGDLSYIPAEASATFTDAARKQDPDGEFALVCCPADMASALETAFESDENVVSYVDVVGQ